AADPARGRARRAGRGGDPEHARPRPAAEPGGRDLTRRERLRARRSGDARARRAGGAAARLRPEQHEQHGRRDRSEHVQGGRALRRRVAPAARGAGVEPPHALRDERHRQFAHADRSAHRQAGKDDRSRGPVQHVLHAERTLRDRRRRAAAAARLPRRAHLRAAQVGVHAVHRPRPHGLLRRRQLRARQLRVLELDGEGRRRARARRGHADARWRRRAPGRQALTRRERLLRRGHARGRAVARRRRPAEGDRLSADRRRRARPLSEPRRQIPLRDEPRGGIDLGAQLPHPEARRDVADSRRRQPGHGRRLRRRSGPVALRALQRRRLRDLDAQRPSPRADPRRPRPARAVRVAPARALLARPHGDTPVTMRLAEARATALVAASAAQAASPALRPSAFVARVDNPWFPLTPGTVYVYRGLEGGSPSREVMTVSRATRLIAGVRATSVQDNVYVGGHLAERTTDWYAQDRAGNVWYLGEDTAELDPEGRVTSREGSWRAGTDGAEAGILMPGHPAVGSGGRQEYLKGEAEDRYRVKALAVHV